MALVRLGLAFLVACATGCATHPTDSPESSKAIASSDLVGDWETEPTPGQFGVTVVKYSFTADGQFTCSAAFASIMKPLATSGSYVLVGDQLRLTTPEMTTAATVRIEEGLLLMTDYKGVLFKFERR